VVVARLQREFPEREIKLRQCPERLGTNGKVSTLIQLAQHARYDYLIINDSDISVSPLYLEQVMAGFAAPEVGMVTALYRGRAHETMASRFEALGIATDFQPSVLLSRLLEGGLHYGLGSTLAVRREALAKAGGLEGLVDQLADDYEMGARIAKGGYRVALSAAVVETAVPAYNWRGYIDHQLRWLRTVRDARPGGYAGLVVTYGLAWALINLIASGLSPLSLWLLALSLFLRLGLAMTVAAEVLSDHQALPSLWLLPLRDLVAIALWSAGFAGNTIVWRGERFQVKGGKLFKAS
jgi:ceramide glucosyltransferase